MRWPPSAAAENCAKVTIFANSLFHRPKQDAYCTRDTFESSHRLHFLSSTVQYAAQPGTPPTPPFFPNRVPQSPLRRRELSQSPCARTLYSTSSSASSAPHVSGMPGFSREFFRTPSLVFVFLASRAPYGDNFSHRGFRTNCAQLGTRSDRGYLPDDAVMNQRELQRYARPTSEHRAALSVSQGWGASKSRR